MTESIIYCIDSSALIDLAQVYPKAVFRTLWQNLSALVNARRLIAPREVQKEIEQKRDDLASWIKKNRKRMIVGLTSEQIEIVGQVSRQFPELIDSSKQIPDADPFVIALTISKNREQRELFDTKKYVVLTSEKWSDNPNKPKIPNVCKHYKVGCIFGSRALTDFFRKEGWTF